MLPKWIFNCFFFFHSVGDGWFVVIVALYFSFFLFESSLEKVLLIVVKIKLVSGLSCALSARDKDNKSMFILLIGYLYSSRKYCNAASRAARKSNPVTLKIFHGIERRKMRAFIYFI